MYMNVNSWETWLHTHKRTDLEEIREQFDSLNNLFYGKLWCHQSMKHMAVAQRLERPQ